MNKKIYLDYNATSHLLPKLTQEIIESLSCPLNASSVHFFGRKAKKLLEQARDRIKNLAGINANNRDVNLVFTGSATESNNLIMKSFYKHNIIALTTEHTSILEHKKYHNNMQLVQVNQNGLIDFDHLISLLSSADISKKTLVVTMLANNETGVLQPIKKISEIAKSFKAYVHSDCVQAFGKIDVNFTDLGIDSISISGHKIGALPGIGALIYNNNVVLEPQIIGGGQEKGIRCGTESVFHATIFGLSSEQAKQNCDLNRKHMEHLQCYLETSILNISNNKAKIWCQNIARLPNTSSIMMPYVDSSLQVIKFDMAGIAISNGSACSSGSIGKSSYVLKAMGLSDQEVQSTIRISTGQSTTKEEIKAFIDVWYRIHQEDCNK
jgi:cysteine desulfurase